MLKRALKSSLWWGGGGGGGGKSNILEAIIWRVTLPHCSQLSDVTLVWFDGFSLSYFHISYHPRLCPRITESLRVEKSIDREYKLLLLAP